MRAPTGSEMDISLSLSTTTTLVPECFTLFSASKAMPAVIAPSPITAMARRFSPRARAATAMPMAAEIEVDEWAVPNAS